MVRRNGRKSIEELYAPKIDNITAKVIKSQLNHPPQSSNNVNGSNMSKRINTERDFGKFLITSNTPYNAKSANGTLGALVLDDLGGGFINSTVAMTSRRKNGRNVPTSIAKGEKCYSKEEKVICLDDVRIDHNKAKTTRSVMTEKNRYNNPNINDNKHNNINNGIESGHKGSKSNYNNQQSHHSHRHIAAHDGSDDDKDDDTEEFFELIRQTVENAIGKSVSDLLNRNFRELGTKIDRFSTELKSTNSLLYNIQTELNNKIVHYGEENSRHFRYLCMKSEYDKMFYQHHTMMTNNNSTPPAPPMTEKNANLKGINEGVTMTLDCDKTTNINCTSHHLGGNSTKVHSNETHKSSSNEHVITPQSSEVGMREILEHIQRFCTQVQMNGSGKGGVCRVSDMKCDEHIKNYRLMNEGLKNTPTYGEEDDDDDEEEEFQMSSDGMTPRSDDHDRMPKNKFIGCGSNSMRSCTTTRGGNGGGDA